ncbi:MAG: ATP-binding protein [Myxococcota bacterium]
MPVAAAGTAVLFAVLAAGQEWIGDPRRTWGMEVSPGFVALWSAVVWLAVRGRPVSHRMAHPLLFSLCLAISLHHGFHQFTLAKPALTTNAALTALACAYFFTARAWFLAAMAVCVLGWLPGAASGGPFAPEWRHWTATLVSGVLLAIASFEAKRRALIRVESLRMLAEKREVEAERALAQAEAANADRLDMEQAMHEAQRRESLGLLAGGIAHDFNNLLTVIGGNVELTRLEPGLPASVRESLETIRSASDRAAQLTRQLLVYSGRAKPMITAVDLGARIDGTVGLFRSLLGPNLVVDLAGPTRPITVQADAALLDQVLINLMQNAIEACADDGGRICVGWGREDAESPGVPRDRVFIEVSDSGCGMDESTRRRMFEPFFTTKKEGTGLGLAAVKGIAEGHGARIRVETSPGTGTRVRFVMPAGERSGSELLPDTPPAPPVAGPVLVVDDQDEVRRVARGFLCAAGYAVREAAGDEDALEALIGEGGAAGAAVVDLTLPGASGYEVAAALRRRVPDLPIVIMSGFDREDAHPSPATRDAFPYVQKPFSQSQLLDALGRAVDDVGGASADA